MKKWLVVVLALALMIGLAGCGEPRAEDTVREYCNALKAADFEKMGTLKAKPAGSEDILGDFDEAKLTILYDYFKKNAANIVYEIKDVKTDGDVSRISVEFRYVDAAEVARRGIQDFVLKAFSMALSSPTEEELEQTLNECFQNAMDTTKTGEATETVVFDCVKTEGKWKIREVSDGLVSVFTCNMNKALEDYGDLIG